MADTYTTNLNLTKPEPGAAEDTWGISLNADLDALDAIFGSGGTAVSMGVVTLDGLTVDGADVFFNSGWIKSNSSLRIDIDNDNNQTDRAFFISHGNASRDVFKASESGDISFYDDTGSTQGLFWDASAESLGIGTTSPSRKVAIFDSVDGYNLELSQTGAYNSGLQSGIVFTGKYNTGNNVTNLASIRGGKENTTNWDFGGNLRFYTRTNGGVDTERLRINSSGNVGIGTNSPTPFKSGARVLEIKDDAGSNDSAELILTNNSSMTDDEYVGSLIFKNTDSSGTPNHFAGLRAKSNSTFGRMDLEFYAGRSRMEDGTPDMVIIPNNDNQANIGIGTTSPSHSIDVFSSDGNIAKFTRDLTTDVSLNVSADNDGTILSTGGVHNFRVFTNNSESARLDSSGNFGIGTTSIDAKLHVESSSDTFLRVEKTGADNLNLIATGAGSRVRGSGDLIFDTGGGNERARLDTSGRLGIGTTSPSSTLHLRDTAAQIKINSDNGQSAYLTFGDANDSTRGGLEYTSTDDLKFQTNNMVEQMVIRYTGEVGIGTSSPSNTLEVNGNIAVNTSSGNNGIKIITGNTAEGFLIFGDAQDNSMGGMSYNNSTNSLSIDCNNSEAIRVDSSQNVGIGTTSPAAKLDVNGGLNSTHAIFSGQTGRGLKVSTQNTLNNDDGVVYDAQTSTGQHLFKTGGTERVRINSTGKIGIGTASPTETLHVMSGVSNDTVAIISGSQSDRGLTISTYASDGRTDGGVDLDAYKSFKFTTDGTERARIDSSGKVGIGTSSPSLRLHSKDTGNYQLDLDSGGTRWRMGAGWSGFHQNSFLLADTANGIRMVVDTNGKVGIGTTSPSSTLEVNAPASNGIKISSTAPYLFFNDTDTAHNYDGSISQSGTTLYVGGATPAQGIVFRNKASFGESARFDTSGNLLVGKSSAGATNTAGHELKANGIAVHTTDNTTTMYLNRKTSDGVLIELRRDNVAKAQIGILSASSGNDAYFSSGSSSTTGVGLRFIDVTTTNAILPCRGDGTTSDNLIDLGSTANRFDDIYATNGTIQTSDRNEKQDIQALTDAETRVATACKGLIRRFRWQDAVAEKGDDARYHFGIIAQDLQDAFTAEGLDAGDYGMFISSTWTDDDGNEQTRLGVRYNELLAFIITTL